MKEKDFICTKTLMLSKVDNMPGNTPPKMTEWGSNLDLSDSNDGGPQNYWMSFFYVYFPSL